MEIYIFVCFVILVAGAALSVVDAQRSDKSARCVLLVISVLGSWRLLDILQANINMHVFDGVRLPGGDRRANYVASQLRSTLISVWNYLEMIGWFSIFYLRLGGLQRGSCSKADSPLDAFYFSTITQLTIGFGDLAPARSSTRLLAMAQGLFGTLFIIFAIGRFASMLPHATDKNSLE